MVGLAARVVEQVGVERAGERVGRQDVEPPVLHERWYVAHRVEQLLQTRPHALLSGASAGARGCVCCPRECEEVGLFRVVELERPTERVEDTVGSACRIAALKARVVLDADTGQPRHFLPAQALHPPASAVGLHPRLLRRDPRSPRGEELTQLITVVHADHAMAVADT